MDDKRDLVILGGGLVGMTLALAAAKNGLSSHVVDRADPADLTAEGFDGRASAISTASWNLFSNIDLADALEPFACPIERIAVSDQLKPGQIDFVPEPEQGSLGRMFENRRLRLALYEAAEREPLIAFHPLSEVAERARGPHGVAVRLADGRTLVGSLMVAAEGRRSPTREEAGLAVATWDYRHRAIIASLVHARPHGGTAWEIFWPAGPFALLPMQDDAEGRHRSALVWTVDEKDAAGTLKLGDRAFHAEIVKRMGDVLGEVLSVGPRSSFPLGFHHTARIVDERLALVGDAAHGIHPIAGQGLNLGLRDVGALVEVIAEGRRLGLDPGDAQLLDRYERWRGLDAFSVALATDGLTRLFGVPGRAASAVRRFGMAGVQRLAPLKTWFMDEARGVSGALPDLLKG
ncbi:UbiH/UbiF/VisC/COQ6 family ubiquinone biosynthesis hydroxylase [Tsuneonella sp. YG55]|uniref:UbiH/UbiF/VisC/COQ6 family ubiquinone biosynthesis hydroxylase n=1 Tax=Tsuneonella litorea TaxID=2976475 RepID=A0A9X2W134_9SPHN|nr:UbiH/UbiF/VisC/COQ6 family ubiquinone biosynthesis hydroxylase [Tsuneonella litorea]MCT2559190.1 UbiH/UbiF/VisC/COQ6 family ubiquinone biosynthesis hydroxylase [Tsuneonella litorea]